MSKPQTWDDRLDRLARMNDGPTKARLARSAIHRSDDWQTCAVGVELNLQEGETPADAEIYELGCEFNRQMTFHDFAAALKVLAEIRRAAADPLKRTAKRKDGYGLITRQCPLLPQPAPRGRPLFLTPCVGGPAHARQVQP